LRPLPAAASSRGDADTVSWLFVEFSIGRWGPDGIALVRGGIVALPPRLRGPRCSMSVSIGGGAGASEDRGFSYGRRLSALTSTGWYCRLAFGLPMHGSRNNVRVV